MFRIKKFEIIVTVIIVGTIMLCVYCSIQKEKKMADNIYMRVNHMYTQDGEHYDKHIPVANAEEAVIVINREADKQVNDISVGWNAFSFEVWDVDSQEWEYYYDEEGRDIEEIMLETD